MSVTDRAEVYRALRLDDQIAWYRHNAERNARRDRAWFCALAFLQVAGIASAVLFPLAMPEFLPTPVPAIAACTAAIVGWSRARRFVDLSKSYTVASHELSHLRELLPSELGEREFHAWVMEVEEAISREHTMWKVKRAI
jgi:hypothetical protein